LIRGIGNRGDNMSTCFLDRELSWLQFNLRVLNEANDRSVPLLERLKFISIYNSNLDEFFMVRVGSLMHREVFMPEYKDRKTGWDTTTQLKKISSEVQKQQERLEKTYKKVLNDFSEKNIDVIDFKHISKLDEIMAKKVFSEVKQMLSLQIVADSQKMPFLWNQEIALAAMIEKGGKQYLGLVSLDRLPKYRVYDINGKQKVIIMHELLNFYSKLIFKEYIVKDSTVIRITRNADVFIDEVERTQGDDSKKSMEKLLKKRKRELPVRLQISGKCSNTLKEYLVKRVGIDEKYVFMSSLPLNMGFGSELKGTGDLKYQDRHPVKTIKLEKGQYFQYLEKRDILLSFPFQSITPYIDMLYEAADDPTVQSIKITLYRVSMSSKIAAALAYAADKGKEVLAVLELRARFDEQNNIDYSEMLEEAGCTVIYGLPDYKVHCKLCLITRTLGSETKYITQVGTGNYNEVTSEQYCDLSMITSKKEVGEDAEEVFNALLLGTLPIKTKSLWVAPYGFKMPLIEALEAERRKGASGYVSIKVNSLNDIDVMNKLIACSQAGVRVELFVRGICCLVPGIKNMTENIHIYSIVGRYLEHSRIFVFGRGEERKIYIGSGDLLNRNTERRVEAFIEVTERELRSQVIEVMDSLRKDKEKKWTLKADGTYEKEEKEEGTASQDHLYEYFGEKIINKNDIKSNFFKKIFKK